ncbi:MAG: hypothetical protein HQK53_05125 [Oligoflexia bacterium]|nr:hypothetical protein [Oligoflexia bacterium]
MKMFLLGLIIIFAVGDTWADFQQEKKLKHTQFIERMEQADLLYKRRGDFTQAQKALELYQSIINGEEFPKITVGDPLAAQRLYLRLAMSHYFVGHHPPEGAASTSNQKQKNFLQGIEYGKKCLQSLERAGQEVTDSVKGECYFWIATNQLLYQQERGSFSVLLNVKEVIQNYQNAIKLFPSYNWGASYRMLGILYQRLPGVFGGSNNASMEYYKKAIEIAPDEPLNYLFLGKLYTELAKSKKEILTLVDQGLIKVGESISEERYESCGALVELKHYKQHQKWPEE